MGLNFMLSGGSTRRTQPINVVVNLQDYKKKHKRTPRYTVVSPNPDPKKFNIIRTNHVKLAGGLYNVVMKVRYKGCTNYEGVKILVYLKVPLLKLSKQKHLDPHFSDNPKYLSPFARFEPTEHGWEAACNVAKIAWWNE